jgi:hypothetical protein
MVSHLKRSFDWSIVGLSALLLAAAGFVCAIARAIAWIIEVFVGGAVGSSHNRPKPE